CARDPYSSGWSSFWYFDLW
nr:immunoglobulin heavy chain junction region [Macaca mulatta]MOW19493.1 immunoglobulin heavy chain junction region [Macaca mulatta]MOW19690.1 immunoglobulin heavy chain junction region [Macaca mulatta]MOW20047.1 immunoglobulin heavy chain junction region [Macaca mulatta]MOW20066.1 immunoglobulin heavy chain junction region [Macaca mulatta]